MMHLWRDECFKFSQLDDFLKRVEELKDSEWELVKYKKGKVYNIPAAFDTETSSIYRYNAKRESEKAAFVYIWQFGIDGLIIYGRTWEEFTEFFSRLVDTLGLSKKRVLIIYVHNLGYDFQFFRTHFSWDKVFSLKTRRPIYAKTGGLEFRCSLMLANASLATVGKNLEKYKVQKLVGDLDYSLVRHSGTPLTEQELGYCLNDIRVLLAYIKEKIENEGDISKIPLTNTGYVRNFVRNECFAKDRKIMFRYRDLMKTLRISSQLEYEMLQRAFQGGFTHASALYSNKVVEEVGSADLASSYPTVICCEYFPMSIGTDVKISRLDEFFGYLREYCCLFDITFYNIRMSQEYETPLSYSRCIIEGEYILNNGRVAKAEVLHTTMTELDFDTIIHFYEWDGFKVGKMLVYDRSYLPKQIIEATLNLYEKKTTLKGIDDKVIEYMISKNMINSIYGMMVTNIVREEAIYDDEEGWLKGTTDVFSQLDSYNKSFNRFLYYAWGVWVTAHARHNLFSAIKEFKNDYVYCDTDSIKGMNFDKHAKYFNEYNIAIKKKMLDMCLTYNIPFEKCCPKDKHGVKHPLGVWEFEPGYAYFKTCGAKRYIYIEKDTGDLNLTVSGLNKKAAVPYLIEAYKGDIGQIFEDFGLGFTVPPGHTGKMTLTYIDEPRVGVVKDYLGNWGVYNELSSIHMEPQGFEMGMLESYLKFLKGIEEVNIT